MTVIQRWSDYTVEPVYSGHPWDTTSWVLYSGGLLIQWNLYIVVTNQLADIQRWFTRMNSLKFFLSSIESDLGFRYDWATVCTINEVTASGPADQILEPGDRIIKVLSYIDASLSYHYSTISPQIKLTLFH